MNSNKAQWSRLAFHFQHGNLLCSIVNYCGWIFRVLRLTVVLVCFRPCFLQLHISGTKVDNIEAKQPTVSSS